LIKPFGSKKSLYSTLICEIQFGAAPGNYMFSWMAVRQQLAHNGRTRHAAVACNVNFGITVHSLFLP
jgi:hypothetical protein